MFLDCSIQITHIDFPKSLQYHKKRDTSKQVIHELLKVTWAVYFEKIRNMVGGNM